MVRKEPKSKDVYIKLLVKVQRASGIGRSKLFGAYLVFTVVAAPAAVQVSFEADRLQVQQGRVEEVVHEQDQQASHFHSTCGELTMQPILYIGDLVL